MQDVRARSRTLSCADSRTVVANRTALIGQRRTTATLAAAQEVLRARTMSADVDDAMTQRSGTHAQRALKQRHSSAEKTHRNRFVKAAQGLHYTEA